MKTYFFIVAVVGVGVVWSLERLTTVTLRLQVDAARQENTELDSLRQERARLQRVVHEGEHLEQRPLGADGGRAKSEPPARNEPAHRGPATNLEVGEWLSPRDWENRGQATPIATVETALWAAAGGDVARLRSMLLLDDEVRSKADAILAQLPDASRATYTSAEQLIAAFTAKSIPLGDAQLVWKHQPAADEAIACVFVRNTDVNAALPTEVPRAQAASENLPPMAAPNAKTSATYLSLRRNDGAWRLVVPTSAVDKIASELGYRLRP